ncbi:MAG: enoyl-CoA hydratase/isomerase family protein [Tetrasphaera sp.]
MADEVLYELRGPVAWVTINRPEARNALNRAVREGLKAAFESAEQDPQVHVVVLTGAGDRVFCAGGDLKEMTAEQLTVPPPDYVPQPNRTVSLSKPVIAAVNGGAFGGGFLLAQSADLVIAAANANFGISEIRIGRGAPWAAPLPWLIPPRIALQLLLTGEPLSATRACEVGLVNEVVPADRLAERSSELAETIAGNAPLSVRAAKQMVYAVADHGRTAAFDVAEDIWRPVYLSRDAQEGMRAFTEKRPPVWEAR